MIDEDDSCHQYDKDENDDINDDLYTISTEGGMLFTA